MGYAFVLIGSIPVSQDAVKFLPWLQTTMAPKEDEFITIRDGRLMVYLDSQDVPCEYTSAAKEAFTEFCGVFATSTKSFNMATGLVSFGPDEELRSLYSAARDKLSSTSQLQAALHA